MPLLLVHLDSGRRRGCPPHAARTIAASAGKAKPKRAAGYSYRHGVFVEFRPSRSDKMEQQSGGARRVMTRTLCRVCPLLYVLTIGLTGCKGLFGSQGLPH